MTEKGYCTYHICWAMYSVHCASCVKLLAAALFFFPSGDPYFSSHKTRNMFITFTSSSRECIPLLFSTALCGVLNWHSAPTTHRQGNLFMCTWEYLP